MPHVKTLSCLQKKNTGFSLFELVVVICLIAILYMTVDERLNHLPAKAERINFFTVLSQLKTSLNVEMLNQRVRGKSGHEEIFQDSNPMDFLLEAPANYLGNLDRVKDDNSKRGVWYFENATAELVYVVDNKSLEHVFIDLSGIMVNFGQIRLKVVNVYTESDDIETVNKNWDGVLLQAVNPYQWESEPRMLANVDLTN